MSADGALRDVTDVGPGSTAIPLITLEYAGHPLTIEDTARVVRRLRAQQQSDGSFVAYPHAPCGCLCATALVWAALRRVGVPPSDPSVRAAWSYIAAQGGLAGVTEALLRRTNFAAIFVAMAGFIDPQTLPVPPPELLLGRLAQSWLRDHIDFPVLGTALIASGSIVEGLRRRAYDHAMTTAIDRGLVTATIACRFRAAALEALRAIEDLADDAAIEALARHQNPNGSLDDTTLQTSFLLGAYHAAGLASDDPRVVRAAGWLRSMLVREEAGDAWFSGFTGDVWATALGLRALLASGSSTDDPSIAPTVRWLLDHQIRDPDRVRSRTRPGAPRHGGWAFEGENVTMPDCDDTGLVLVSLGHSIHRVDAVLQGDVQSAIHRAAAWLEGTQCADGGWSAFDFSEDEKPRGPLYTDEIGLVADNLVDTVKNLLSPPAGLGTVAWEDVTARVLYGLGLAGWTIDAPMIARGVEFLRRHQFDHGGWWGRWMVNYLPTTAYALLGLQAVGVDPQAPWIERAIDFLLEHQNPDGGWGESEATYRSPALAGRGSSMPPLTGLVLTALLRCGRADAPEVARGIDYLLSTIRDDGTWPNGGWLHAFFPPQSYYVYSRMPCLYPLEALGLYRRVAVRQHRAPRRAPPATRATAPRIAAASTSTRRRVLPPPRWSDTFLDAMRQVGDPSADRLVHDLAVTDGITAHALLRGLMTSDDALPAGMPARVDDFFASEGALPSFADRERLAIAQRLFARTGWSMATGLLCSALPQTYAAARGAKVLAQSGRLESDTRRRILATAQFVFDVADGAALTDGGRGVVSALRVRLIHASIRDLTASSPSWSRADGLPINQEDSAATLLAFSTVILSALDRLGVATTAAERDAWFHLWRVVGAVMGIDRALLADDLDDADALLRAVRRRHWAASPQGARLTRALLASIQEYMPGPAFKSLPAALVRHLAGDTCADLLEVPRADWTNLFMDAFAGLQSALAAGDATTELGHVLQRFQSALMHGMVRAQQIGKEGALRLPTVLLAPTL